MHRTLITITLAVLILAFVAVPAQADVLHLKNGGRIEGVVTERGDEYVVEHRFGTATVKKADVLRVEKKESLQEKYEKRLAGIDREDPDARVALGHWLRENGWEAQAVKEFVAALALDPEHHGAHTALGHVFYEGAWRTEDEVMESKGFVRFRGDWVTPREKERIEAVEERARLAKDAEKADRALARRIRGDLRLIAYGTKDQCEKAHADLVTLARESDNEALEKFAGDVKAYFDQYWQIVKKQNEMALTEVRATISRLKRPIPTFTTSLGGGSTPVTLQLPELTVWSVKTTVPVPAGR